MTKIWNFLIMIGGVFVVIFLIISRLKPRKNVEKQIILNRIERRKNTIVDLDKKRDALNEQIENADGMALKQKKKLEDIKATRNKMKEEIKAEIKEVSDEELASELGYLLDSL